MRDLTPRDVRMLRLLASGYTQQQAARQLGMSAHAVRIATSRIYAKLGAHTAAHAVSIAHQRGLLDAPGQRSGVAA